jgi:phage virion morphogenesis protein
MIRVEFNAKAAVAALREAMTRLTDMTPTFQDVGEYLRRSTTARFQRGIDPQGRPWAPKSAATLERYKRLGYGVLTRPLIGKSRQLSTNVVLNVGRDRAEVGSNAPYAAVMQFGAARGAFGQTSRGGPIPWGRIPARAWLGISTEDEQAIVGIVEEHLDGTLSADG